MIFKIFIILFLIFVIWPVVKVIYYLSNARKFARQQQDAFRKAYSQSAPGSASGNYSTGNSGHHTRKKKIFSKADGEYVEFEEISCDMPGEASSSTTDTYIREDQVSDAEWTEVK